MKTCPFCKAEIAENARFCLYCMTSLEEKEKIQIAINNKRWMFFLTTALVFMCILITVLVIVGKNSHLDSSSHTSSSDNLSSNSSTTNFEVTSTDDFENSIVQNSINSHISSVSPPSNSNITPSVNSANSTNSNSNPSNTSNSNTSSKDNTYPFTYILKNGEIHIVKGNENLSGALNIPNTIDGYPVTRILLYAFSGNTKITSLTIPKNVTYIEDSAFSNCKNLAVVNFSEGLKTIDNYVFQGCKIKHLNLPNSVINIYDQSFSYCQSLTTVILPDNLETIRFGLFEGCINLTTITLPKKLKSISDAAFLDCKKLTTVYYPGNETDKNKIYYLDETKPLANATWYYEIER